MKRLTDRQLDLMNIVWENGSATVREVKDAMEENLAYTSVLTVFQTLEQNDVVRHEPEGKAYRYFPLWSREDAALAEIRFLRRNEILESVVDLGEDMLDRAAPGV